jgi:hypothetical protein
MEKAESRQGTLLRSARSAGAVLPDMTRNPAKQGAAAVKIKRFFVNRLKVRPRKPVATAA